MTDLAPLTQPWLVNWLSDVHTALGQLVAGGLSHPGADLPYTFEALAERAEQLGTPTAGRALNTLFDGLMQLAPGPSALHERIVLTNQLESDLQAFLAWLRAFEDDIGFSVALARSQGHEVAPVVLDVPSWSGTVELDGVVRTGDRLVWIGHEPSGEPVHLVDHLAAVDELDPFGTPVVSRLFQEQLVLRDLERQAIELDRHPFGVRLGRRMVGPHFDRIPERSTWVPMRSGREVLQGRLRIRLDESVSAEGPDGKPMEISDSLELHLWSAGCHLGSAFELPARFLKERSGWVLIALEEPERLLFPHVDPKSRRLDPAQWLEHPDAAVRMGAVSMRDRVLCPSLASLFVEDIDLRNPSFLDVASHANRLLRTDETDAADHYLRAHLSHLARTAAKGAVIPKSKDLLAAAVVLDALQTAMPGAALELPVFRMRRRYVRQAFLLTQDAIPADEFAATLGLAAVSDW